jgi:hypothetical protein
MPRELEEEGEGLRRELATCFREGVFPHESPPFHFLIGCEEAEHFHFRPMREGVLHDDDRRVRVRTPEAPQGAEGIERAHAAEDVGEVDDVEGQTPVTVDILRVRNAHAGAPRHLNGNIGIEEVEGILSTFEVREEHASNTMGPAAEIKDIYPMPGMMDLRENRSIQVLLVEVCFEVPTVLLGRASLRDSERHCAYVRMFFECVNYLHYPSFFSTIPPCNITPLPLRIH